MTTAPALHRKLAWAGIIAPIWFVGMIVLQGALQPDYSHIKMPISALAAWPRGWMQQLNFLVFAPLVLLYAIALHGLVRPTKRGWVGALLLGLTSVGLALAGLFSWRVEKDGFFVPPLHVVGALTTFSTVSLGHIIFSFRMKADPAWQPLARFTLLCGIGVLIFFIVTGGFAMEPDAPLHDYAGLCQRALVFFWVPCMFVLSLRARQIGRQERSARP